MPAFHPPPSGDGKYGDGFWPTIVIPKELLHYCLERETVPLAPSAATWRAAWYRLTSSNRAEYEKPLNVYGYSKFLFDEYVRQILPEANSHRRFPAISTSADHVKAIKVKHGKRGFHLNTQLNNGESPKLFEGSENFARLRLRGRCGRR